MQSIYSLVSALILCLPFAFGRLIQVDRFRHRRRWISAAAGASVAYVFVHIFPELSEQQAAYAKAADQSAFFSEVHVYLAALIGFVLFFGLDTMAVSFRTVEHETDGSNRHSNLTYWLHISTMALNAGLICYLLVDWNKTPRSLLLYTLAMAFHLLIYDHVLRDEYGSRYDCQGRWLLMTFVFVGWILGVIAALPDRTIEIMVGFMAGSVTINGIRDELPRSGEGRFAPFALGTAIYTLLLLL
ncbi:MAG: hypothetical protein ABFD49_11675 [Armatimonadota bacterium]|nr:hypothetical protein [bacterium]